MPANVETMFYVRETPWHGLGTKVMEAPTSKKALDLAGLNWAVTQKKLMSEDGDLVPGYRLNVRSTDQRILGVVSDRYKVVQNDEAFAFTDALLGEGVTYETAGSLRGGRAIWILAKMPERYALFGDDVTPYMVFMNTHDGTGAIKVAMTPVRVVCQNTLNLALSSAKRSWATNHMGDIAGKMEDARNTLVYATQYMQSLTLEVETLASKDLTKDDVYGLVTELFPTPDKATDLQIKNLDKQRVDLTSRFFDAPDLQHVGMNAYRFVNAVSDFATHAAPLRMTVNYQDNLFAKTVEGHPVIDKAYELVQAL